MKNTLRKKMLIALLGAFVAICAGFALLLARPASSASAEETTETPTYSETWVMNSTWHLFTGVNCSLTINGKVESVEFSKFIGNSVAVQVIDIATQKTIILGNNATGSYVYYDPTTNLSIPYSEWKDTYGKITFYEDTSAEKFSDLRAWLEENATQIFVQVWYNGDIAQCVSVPLGTTYEQLDKTKAPTRAGYTCIGWSNEENGEVATGTLRYSDSSGVLYIQVYPVYAKEAPAQAAKYTVTFKDGEKILYTLSAESGKAINLSEYPEINESAAKTGYTFKGWAARIDGAVIAKNGYLPNITADTIFYAVYEKTSGTDFPSDNPSDNPDTPADDKPSDTDKPADKPSDGSGDNITLDKSDVKKYVGITLGVLGVLLVMAFMVNVFGRRR